MPDYVFRLALFDQDVCISTDSRAYSDLLLRTYRHFLVDGGGTDDRFPLKVSFYTQHPPSNRPVFRINDQELQISNPDLINSPYTHALILNALYKNVRSHFLYHAAALVYQGQGILLCADSGFGKTTLTLALLQAGFEFLSDEIAAVGRKDGLLYPFPRGLHIREETLNLLELPVFIDDKPRWFGKYLVDIDEIFPEAIAEPAQLAHVFILKDRNPSTAAGSTPPVLKALVSHTSPEFLEQLKEGSEILAAQVYQEQGLPCLRIQTSNKGKTIPFIEDVCAQHDIVILDLIKRESLTPDFGKPVYFQKISKSQAAIELLRHFLGGQQTELLSSEHHPDSANLLFELASLLKHASCYQLTPGPLPELAHRIASLVRSPAPNYS